MMEVGGRDERETGVLRRKLVADCDKHDHDHEYDVVIVGAGWAGLAAAARLAEDEESNGRRRRFRVLEARDRVGGRSQTEIVEFEGASYPIELGSGWMHGAVDHDDDESERRHPIVDAANDLGRSWTVDPDRKVFRRGDRVLTWTETNRLEAVHEAFLAFHANEQHKRLDDDGDVCLRTVANAFSTTAARGEISFDVDADVYVDAESLEFVLSHNVEHWEAADLENLSSSRWNGHEGTLEGGDEATIDQGYGSLAKAYGERVREHTELEAIVTRIDHNHPKLVTIEYRDARDGTLRTLTARRVLLTVPLGVLKAGSIMFDPPLPPEKVNVVGRLGMGSHNKIVMLWKRDEVFWLNNNDGGDDEDGPFWILDVAAPPDGIRHEFWTPGGGAPYLVAYLNGSDAASFEAIDGDDDEYGEALTRSAVDALRRLYGDAVVPRPETIVATAWGRDPFARGAYSFDAIGTRSGDRRALAAAVGDGRVSFAGEATSAEDFGTTHGAWCEGRAAAERILTEETREKEQGR